MNNAFQVLVLLVACTAGSHSRAAPPPKAWQMVADGLPQQATFFDPSATPEAIFTGGCGIMEGMAVAADGRIFFSEITRSAACADAKGVPGGRLWSYDPAARQLRLFREPSNMAAGLAIDRSGALIAAEGGDHGGRRISRTDLSTGEYRTVAYFFEHRQFNAPNDVAVDGSGRIFFSDLRLFGQELIEQRINGVYRLDPPPPGAKGTWPITRVSANNAKINGIELSRDGQVLYAGLCELGSNAVDEQAAPDLPRNGPAGVLAYDVREDGSLGQARVWADFDNGGCVDGMTTDERGHLFVAFNGSPAMRGVYVFSPQGQLLARYQLPNQEIAVNLVLGTGADARSLYLATLGVGKVYRLRLAGRP